MKVILLQDVKKLGKKGDVIEASDGYARNYLFPKKLATEATANELHVLNAKKENERKKKLAELEEAQKLAVLDYELPVEALSFEVLRESKGFLGIGAKLEVEADIAADGIEQGKKYIKTILDYNGVEGFIEKKVRGNNVEFNIDAGKFNGYLIGRESHNLIALQILVSTIVNRYYDEDNKKIVLVDVGGYKKKREKALEHMAVEWGKQVTRTKKSVTVTDLNAYERKIIHNKLSTWDSVSTHSEGETPNRVLIIEYKEIEKK